MPDLDGGQVSLAMSHKVTHRLHRAARRHLDDRVTVKVLQTTAFSAPMNACRAVRDAVRLQFIDGIEH